MLANYHIHTNHSIDSKYKMEDVVRDAINLGIDEICFTDHVDYGVREFFTTYEQYFAEIEAMQEKYGSQIAIKKGLELAPQVHTIPRFEALHQKYPLDFALLSIHQINDTEIGRKYASGRDKYEYGREYYQELLDVINRYDGYSVLAHLDMIRRYGEDPGTTLSDHRDIVAEILKLAIRKDKGIELNTSARRYKLDEIMPSRDIFALYLDLGGKIITIGSDSHRQEHLGMDLIEGRAALKEIGFKEFCTFNKMKPIFHKL